MLRCIAPLLLLLFFSAPARAQTGADPYADGLARSRPAKLIDSIYVKPYELYERLPNGDYRKARYEDVLVGRGYEPFKNKGQWTETFASLF